MSQKFPINNSRWIENFIKNYNEESDEGYFLEADVQYPEKFHELHNDYLKESILQNLKNLLLIYMIKLNMLFT